MLKGTINDKNTIIALLKQKSTVQHVDKNNQMKVIQKSKISASATRALAFVSNKLNQNVNGSSNETLDQVDPSNCNNIDQSKNGKVSHVNIISQDYLAACLKKCDNVVIDREACDGFQIVKHRRERKKPNYTNLANINPKVDLAGVKQTCVIGSSKVASDLCDVGRKCWLHVSRVSASASENTMNTFLNSKFPNEEFLCTKLSTYFDVSSFKVGTNMAINQRV